MQSRKEEVQKRRLGRKEGGREGKEVQKERR